MRSSPTPISRPRADPARVLTKALLRAGDALGLPRRALATIVGVSEATMSRVGSGRPITPHSKAGEHALLFLRVFRSLDAMFGGDLDNCRRWLIAKNDHLGAAPKDLIKTTIGLVHVADYLDAMRGRA